MVPTEFSNEARPNILYIDDDPINRSLVNRLLTNYNFKVLEAETGLEGIVIARSEHPALILMDINMPGLDGHETTTRMRSIASLQQTPIVAVTARTTRGERELALAAGCDGFITKPIDVDVFPHQVISYLDGYRETISIIERQHYLGHYSQKLVERLESKIVELEEANSQLQKIDKLKSDFITLAAHELRTPIALVYGYARLLQSAINKIKPATGDHTEIGALARKIYKSIHRLNEVVNDVLNISLIEANEMRLLSQPVILSEIIDAALKELNPAKHGRTLDINSKNLEVLPTIMGDRQRLQQVFWNILSNAIKFTPDGGSIVLGGWVTNSNDTYAQHPSNSSPVNKSFRQEGIIISIKDSGIGIDPTDQKEVFKRFYIVGDTAYHSSSKIAFGGGGMGLGLPIARGIIEAHGGQIWVESKGQKGTNPGSTFFVYLPYGISRSQGS